jgi:hypothetical protein
MILLFILFICYPLKEIVGLPNNSYKPITNTAWVRARLCELHKRVLLPPLKLVAMILLKVALNKNQSM